MNFKEEYQKRTELIEDILQKYLPEQTGYQKVIMEAMEYSLMAGGKRLRPMLMRESFELFGGKGKRIDFGLRNPQEVQKIDGYDLPSDDDLLLQEIDQIICETCFLAEHCTKMDCMMSPAQKQAIQQQMFREVTRHSIEEQQEP